MMMAGAVSNVAWKYQQRRASIWGSASLLTLCAIAFPITPASAQEITEESASTADDIVVLGTRSTVDRTLSSDRVTQRMSQSSRSIERDILDAAGTYRLSDAL